MHRLLTNTGAEGDSFAPVTWDGAITPGDYPPTNITATMDGDPLAVTGVHADEDASVTVMLGAPITSGTFRIIISGPTALPFVDGLHAAFPQHQDNV